MMKMKESIIITALLFALVGHAMAAATTMSVADSKGAKGETVKVPINVAGASNLGALGLSLTYDSSVLKGIRAEGGTLASNSMVESNELKPGTLRISLIDSKGILGDGGIVDVTFEVLGDTGTSTQISMEAVGWDTNRLDVPLKTSPGTFRVEEKGFPIVPVLIAIVVLLVLFFVVKKISKKKK
jgi:type 1 fimbria pilin